MIASSTLSLSVLLSSALAFTPCPIQGPDYPAPSGLADDPVFKDVISKLTQSLDNATEQSNALLTNLKANETSYSVVVFDAKSTLLSYHHTADALTLAPESVSEVTGMCAPSFIHSSQANKSIKEDTVYRVGSISKLLFLYTFLVEAGHDYWHRPITDFVPELVEASESCSAEADPLTCPDWDEITLGALASHLAGLGRGRPVTPAPPKIGGVPVTSLGLPPKPVIELAQCEKQPCTRAESIRAFLQEAPVEQAFSTPIYSNGAYQILTYALEAITNRTMSDMITDDVFCPLNMDDSSYSLKANASGIVPNSTSGSFWNVPLGDAGATGGVYSSSRDMVKLGQSILNKTQLSPSSTRKWLKPWAHTAVWQQAVGLAWEIARWPVEDRIVDVYTKQGDLGMSRITLSHD
jgi:CubicO group peptidase (beta-lactamase class C family)